MSAPKDQPETPNRKNRPKQPVEAGRPAASVNMDELRELIGLLRDNGLAELELENEGFRVRLRRDSGLGESSHASTTHPAPAPAPAPTAPASSGPAHPGTQATTAAAQDQDLHIISSPIVGTFYRSASPAADPIV